MTTTTTEAAGAPRPAGQTEADVALATYREMVRIRHFEEKCAELYSAGKIRGFLHLYVGEEAVAAGLIPALEADDAVVSTYREHGHALARGVPAKRVMAEMFGKKEGCSGGRGGSMHLFDASRRFYGGNAIVAGGLPVAVGLALADSMMHRRRVTLCLFGDGATDEGEFHESLNLASLWSLPVLFVCENNRYAMGTALERHQAQTDLSIKARSYAIEAEQVDGMDVDAVAAAARRAVDGVRASGRPHFLEMLTYRFRAHSMFDPELYRSKAEVDQWRRRDPINLFDARLAARGWLDDARRRAIGEEVDAEIADAIAFAEAGTLEPISDLTKDVTTPRVTS
jgi:pyruvate dehydrogenase E1 component alpha subunit